MSNLAITIGNKTFEIDLESLINPDEAFEIKVNGQFVRVIIPEGEANGDNNDWLIINDRPYEILLDRDFRWIKSAENFLPINIRDREAQTIRLRTSDGRVKAPIPGLVSRVMVAEGNTVEIGQPLLVLEAMKMENEIRASTAGIVKTVNVKAGQSVKLHEVLAEIV